MTVKILYEKEIVYLNKYYKIILILFYPFSKNNKKSYDFALVNVIHHIGIEKENIAKIINDQIKNQLLY